MLIIGLKVGRVEVAEGVCLISGRFSHLTRLSSVQLSAIELVPAAVPLILAEGGVSFLRAEERVLEAMLEGWRAQMLACGLCTSSVQNACRTVQRFDEHCNEYPWSWRAQHVDEFFADQRSRTDTSSRCRRCGRTPVRCGRSVPI